MFHQISLAWSNIKNNRRTKGLLFLDNWHDVNLWCNKNKLSTLAYVLPNFRTIDDYAKD